MTGSENDPVAPYAAEIAALGRELGLPFIAVSADLSSPEPMVDAQGRPYAETLFRWVDPGLEYWKDRSFALKSPFVLAARYMAEPFYFADGRLATWRPTASLEGIDASRAARDHGVGCAIIAPAYMPGGVIGAVVWATPDDTVPVADIFAAQAPRLHAAALRFIGAYHDAHGALPVSGGPRLTRREIQCLKWAAAGKTDAEIGEQVRISAPTVRFHLKNAAEKLNVVGRSQAVREAAALGYVGLGLNPARQSPV
ncbi:MAG TPA: LuxR C-terminal-related transcriptional regulator [Phenylobacterium sp.]|nr:LuxR C-terminal-related transcriptional regulator [Phenylobacterium sp.]